VKHRILLVDDDPALRSMLGFSLETFGYEVVEVDSKQQAIDVLGKSIFPVVLLDMGMPPNEHTPDEGLAVLDWLNDHQPNAKTVVLTGQNADSTSYLALRHGAFDFLSKPVSNEQMLQAIERAALFYDQESKLKENEGLQKVQVEAQLGTGVKSIRNSAEKKLLKSVLSDTNFNVHETARRLGLKRENVYYLIKKYSIQRDSSE
jgi:DNA-binding NtrC family response regulator